ncbi:TPA: helix-turn-helix domain-containing protein [Providencia rettgeri]|uniref:helix-turn-helix domain-containing protein n=1 Tax=Providencia vermicola TaxID=333965 RepID=UPI0032DA770A
MKDEFVNSVSILNDRENITHFIARCIGRKIRQLRNKYNLSGSELANVIGISQQQLSRYENGLNDISVSKLMLISIYFNIDASFFFEKEK